MLADDGRVPFDELAAMLRIPFFLAVVAIALPACIPLEPHRYRLAKDGVTCNADNATTPDCRNAVVERADDYALHFVEFDDQGLQYPDDRVPPSSGLTDADLEEHCRVELPDCRHPRAWAYQINNLVKELDRAAAEKPITLLIFVHGWKHDASADDGNVVAFRRLLSGMAFIEKNRARFEKDAGARISTERKVVGLYVSWRGHSLDVPGLDNITFWSRKTAAMHVAEGSSRELFARLRAFKCVQNTRARGVARGDCSLAPTRDDAVKVVLIGHSFGGLIVYNSLSGSLIETMTHAFDSREDDNAKYWRFADLAVLINPAFEATRYAPLHRIAASSAYGHYEPPLLVTVTSTTDTATGTWFKLGRLANTLFEAHVNDDERSANRETVGHHDAYLTHRMTLVPDAAAACTKEGWRLTGDLPADQLMSTFERDLEIEYNNSRDFFRSHAKPDSPGSFAMTETPWVRDFCGGARLTMIGGKSNNPIWNISAVGDKDLLPDHSDIGEPRFVAVFRQLYLDTIFLDLMVKPGGVPAIVRP